MKTVCFTFITLLVGSLLYLPVFNSTASAQPTGVIQGQSLDRDTNDPLSFVYLHLEELNRTVTAHTDGSFQFKNIPAGQYTLSASRIGYQSISQTVSITAGDTTTVNVTLKSSVLSGNTIEVVGQKEHQGANLEHASKSIFGTALRQNLNTTLASTLENIPGISARKMGAAPARPVMRGLGGERLLILQDGTRTGDVSSQSADHAVTVDPMAAEQVEIARGPAALQYGANAIGGVINVVRNQIPTSLPQHLHGTASVQGASVNTGAVAALEASTPINNQLALKIDGNLRSAGNIDTPSGTLANSGIFSTNNAAGLSYLQPWGYAGLAGSMYLNNYGIPPDPDGGHENGVDIEMRKYQLEARTEIALNQQFFKSLKADLSYKNYYHQEIEPGGAIGTEYGLLTTNASIVLNHGETGFLTDGSIGIWGEQKNYAVNGTQTPDSDAYSLAAFIIEEKDFGPFASCEAGLRFDIVNTVPAMEETSDIGQIRERTFTALASSATAIYGLGSGFFTGATILHSFRAPSQEELYSEGPHLASYSYEVGNPDLNPERGLGTELFFRHKTTASTTELALYYNDFTNYIYPRNTGQPSPRFPSLNVYQFTGSEANFRGFEFSSELKILEHWAVSGNLHYTFARRKLTESEQQLDPDQGQWQPLPMIPPLAGGMGVTYAKGGFQLGGKGRFAAKQTRTGDFETPTDGYALVDLFGQYRFQSGKLLHTFSLNTENIFNTTYRSHLSRIKDLMPEPGRSVSLLYRMYFLNPNRI
ncbi:MAG: TonB-dependent receptor [Fodinibius sp.]|nr:TonB-dependent receptor [Fodinibius sp.]